MNSGIISYKGAYILYKYFLKKFISSSRDGSRLLSSGAKVEFFFKDKINIFSNFFLKIYIIIRVFVKKKIPKNTAALLDN
jgi:hypothetical protein